METKQYFFKNTLLFILFSLLSVTSQPLFSQSGSSVSVNAGSDVKICQNLSHKVSGATVFPANASYSWSHDGNGTLSDEMTLVPTYSSVSSDAGKVVVLTLTAQDDGSSDPVTDQMTITVVEQVVANAGMNATICQNSSHKISGASIIHGNGNYVWSDNGKGTVIDRSSLMPTYTASVLDAGKTVTFTLKAYGNENCPAVTSSMTIGVVEQVVSYAGSDVSICENSAYTVFDATIENGNGMFDWSHDGAGTLSNDDTLSPTYTPGASDVGQTVILTLTAEGNADCISGISEKKIFVQEQVHVLKVGNDTTICQNTALQVTGAIIEHGNGIVYWTHDGKGELAGSNTLSPTYTPHSLDAGKSVILTLTAEGKADCLSATGEMEITVEALVTVNAGDNVSICENDTYKVIGAEIKHGNGIFSWTHNGQGTLLDDNTLSPTYAPNPLDAGETVTLTLTAQGNADCSSASDQVTIRVDKQVSGSIGPNDTVCGTSYILSGSGNGGAGVWSFVSGPDEVSFVPHNDVETPKVIVSTPGEYIFKWTYSNGQCIDESTVAIDFKEVPYATIESETEVCGLEQVISASPNKGTGYWQIISGSQGVLFDRDINNNNNKIIVEKVGEYALSWTADLDGCIDTAFQTIIFHKVPNVNAGSDKEVFYNREVVLEASLENGETGYWEIEEGFGHFESKHLPITKVTDLQIGKNIFEWIVNNGVCESRNSVLIEVSNAQIPNIITPNREKNRFFVIKDVENLGPIHLVIFNRWGNKVYESHNYENTWNGRDTGGKELMNDTYYYYVELANKKVIKGYVLIQR